MNLKNGLVTAVLMAGISATAQASDFNIGGLQFHKETQCVEKQVPRTTYHTETKVVPRKHIEWETHTGTKKVPKIVWEEKTFEYRTPKCVTTCEEVQVCVPERTCETVVVPRTRLKVDYNCERAPLLQGLKGLLSGIGDGFNKASGRICPTPGYNHCNPCYEAPVQRPCCGPAMQGPVYGPVIRPGTPTPAVPPAINVPAVPTPATNPTDPIHSPTYKAP